MPIYYDIVLASYNGENFIEDQIKSILNSVAACSLGILHRLIISDDGSTDSTCEIVKELQLCDSRIFLVQNVNSKGVVGNFNFGLSISTSDYVFLSDQDDIWYIDKISISLEEMLKRERRPISVPVLVLGNVDFVDERLENLNLSHDFVAEQVADSRMICFRSFGQGCTMLCNRELLNKALPLPSECVMHDWWLLLVASNFGVVFYIEKKLMAYRQHMSNVTGGIRNRRFSRFYDINSQIIYVRAVSQQSRYFLKRYNEGHDVRREVFIRLSFLSDLALKTFMQRLSFSKNVFLFKGIVNKVKFVLQIILG